MPTANKNAYSPAIGATIKEIREMTADEKEAYAWEDRRWALVIVLDNGFCLVPKSDEEGNGPGDLNIERKNFGGAEEPMKLAEVETLEHLREYVAQVLPGSTVETTTSNGIVIHTGLDFQMGGTLYPLKEDD